MIYLCCNRDRARKVREHPVFNGIDLLEVMDRQAPPGTPRQRTLLVRLLKPPAGLGRDNVLIEGGERITPVRALWAHPATAIPPAGLGTGEDAAFFAGLEAADETLVVRTDSSGDYSTYTLRLVRSPDNLLPPLNIDPRLSSVAFSFKVECPTEFDCHAERSCPETDAPAPEISYLAKDYASFRRLMLDRLSLIMPDWRDRGPADVQVTLVELLAYVADHLSYQQDAIATEAYLGTARRRISVRRHARLIDYRMHDGSNARAWVQILLDPGAGGGPIIVERKTLLLTGAGNLPLRIPKTPPPVPPSPLEAALRKGPTVFETLHAGRLFLAHEKMPFYTWSDSACCIPKGAVRATLKGHFPGLRARGDGEAGDVLIFEEVRGPVTGRPADADPLKRHAVQLTAVKAFASGNEDGEPVPLTDVVAGEKITEIRWHADDALPFPLCVSSISDRDLGEVLLTDVSIALGNIVLADHGATIAGERLGAVPQPHLFIVQKAADACAHPERVPVPPRFRPSLREQPLTQAAVYDLLQPPPSATAATHWPLANVRPAIELAGNLDDVPSLWRAVPDLLTCRTADPCFVAEVEADGRVELRFGDDRNGLRPQSGTAFTATYRVGNGRAGNVGAGALSQIVSDDDRLIGIRNPLPARGGVDPETSEDVRLKAPFAFRTQERTVTIEDYEQLAGQAEGIQRAAATYRWTGSWHTAFVTLDRVGGAKLTPELETAMRGRLEPYRLAGHDLEIDDPRAAPLELHLRVCVHPDFFRASVKPAVLAALSNRRLPDGRLGLFHPDRLTFGQTIYLSTVYAAVQAVPGVTEVEVTRFHRQGPADMKPLDDGFLRLDRLEIARLDNDPSFPERGFLRLTLGGGK